MLPLPERITALQSVGREERDLFATSGQGRIGLGNYWPRKTSKGDSCQMVCLKLSNFGRLDVGGVAQNSRQLTIPVSEWLQPVSFPHLLQNNDSKVTRFYLQQILLDWLSNYIAIQALMYEERMQRGL